MGNATFDSILVATAVGDLQCELHYISDDNRLTLPKELRRLLVVCSLVIVVIIVVVVIVG